MKKEKVVVFDGEDKFINPKNQVYDKTTGKAEFVEFNPDKPTPEYQEFKRYIQNQEVDVVVPSPLDTNFCADVKVFIESRGQGRATPEQLMEAHNLFKQYCIEKPGGIGSPQDGASPASPIDYPQWIALDCNTIDSELNRLREMATSISDRVQLTELKAEIIKGLAVKDAKCASPKGDVPPASSTPPTEPTPPTPPADTPAPPPSTGSGTVSTSPPAFVPLNVPSLGRPPASGASGGAKGAAGGASDKEPEKKKPNWLLWLLVGGLVIYFATKKNSTK